MRAAAELIVNLYLTCILAGCFAFALLWFGVMDRTLHRHRGLHWASADRPSWSVVAEARALVDLPPPTLRRDRLVVPHVYEALAEMSTYTRALRSMRLRSARYTERG